MEQTTRKSFTKARRVLDFEIDGDVFVAWPALPADVMLAFAERFGAMSLDTPIQEQLSAFRSILADVLEPESLALMTKRMGDRDKPVDIDQVAEVLQWLLEEYGMRPTQPPGSSADGLPSPASGMSLTESTRGEVSISDLSLSTSS